MTRSSISKIDRHAVLRCAFAGLISGLLLAPSFVLAQEYEQLPVDLAQRSNVLAVQSMLRGNASLDQQVFDQFFNNFVFAQLTVVEAPPTAGGRTPRPPVNPGKQRRDLFNRYFSAATNAPALARLNDITLTAMQSLVDGPYHPGTRINAAIIIGLLDEQRAAGLGARPVPLPAAEPVLLAYLANEEMADAIKVEALVGLERHARYGGLAGGRRSEASAAALALVNQTTPPGDRDPGGHAWMRGQAADLLVTLGEVGPQNEVIEGLHGMLAEPGARRSQRCKAAQALGGFEYNADSAVAASAILPDLIRLAIDACKEDTAIAEKRLKQAAVVPIRGQVVVKSVASGFPRRRLATVLYSVKMGLAAASAGTEQQKATAFALTGQIDAAMKLLEDTKKSDQELVSNFKINCSQLESMLDSLQRPAEPEQEVTTEDQEDADVEPDLFGGQ